MNLLTNISKNLFKKQASRIQNIANDLKTIAIGSICALPN